MHSKCIVLATLWVLMGLSSGSEGAPERPASIVYRGDFRSPHQIRMAGGFHPAGSYQDNDEAFSMAHHAQGPGADSPWLSAFVSVSDKMHTAANNGPWLYKMHATRNMLDPNSDDADETEIFALGGVPWKQVMAYQYLGWPRPEIIPNTSFTASPDYRHDLYKTLTVTMNVPPGFYRDAGRSAAIQLMAKPGIGNVVGWTGRFPLVFPRMLANSAVPAWTVPPPAEVPRPFLSPDPSLTGVDLLAAVDYISQHQPRCSTPQHDYQAMERLEKMHQILLLKLWELPPTGVLHQIAIAETGTRKTLSLLPQQDTTCALTEACDSVFGRTPPTPTGSEIQHNDVLVGVTLAQPALGKTRPSFKSFCRKIDEMSACTHVDHLELGFAVRSRPLRSSRARISVTVRSDKGRTTFEHVDVLDYDTSKWPLRKWFPLNIKELSGYEHLRVDNSDLVINVTTPESSWKYLWGGCKIENLLLRAQCVGSKQKVVVDKFQRLKQSWKVTTTRPLVNLTVSPPDWRMRPPCLFIDELYVKLVVSATFWSGTYDRIEVGFGPGRATVVLGEKLERATSVQKQIDLESVFGDKVVTLSDMETIQLIDVPHNTSSSGRDEWKVQDLGLTARCAGSREQILFDEYWGMDKWFKYGSEIMPEGTWNGVMAAEDWHK